MHGGRTASLIAAVLTLFMAWRATATADDQLVERGAFRLHLFKRPTGRESYSIRRSGRELVLEASYENTDRGVREPLEASLRLREDGSPISYTVKGKTSRFSEVDVAVSVEEAAATVRRGEKTTRVPRPGRFFCIGGFAPVSVQMMLVRDWERARLPDPLETMPGGSVTIERRGRDDFELAGQRISLDRYSVGGVVWGRETLWLDADRELVAAITLDAEFNRFEAIREGFE